MQCVHAMFFANVCLGVCVSIFSSLLEIFSCSTIVVFGLRVGLLRICIIFYMRSMSIKHLFRLCYPTGLHVVLHVSAQLSGLMFLRTCQLLKQTFCPGREQR